MELTPPHRYVNRELSQLDFQERVLALAERSDKPLLERVNFVAIVSHNLDEFFQVRVAALLEQARSGVTATSSDGMTAREQLAAIRERVVDLSQRIDSLYIKELQPALEDAGISVSEYDDLDQAERAELAGVFEEQIFPVLTPLAVDLAHPFPYISDLSLNLAVLVRSPHREDLQFARIKIPPNVPRLIPLAEGTRWVPLEQVVNGHLDRLFGGQEVMDSYTFRVTRSADLAVEEEEADDLLEAMETVLRYRQRAALAVRLDVRPRMPDEVVRILLQGLQLETDAVYRREGLLGLSGLWQLYALDRPDLKDEPWTPTTQPRLSDQGGQRVDLFAEVQLGDILVHHPYESFATSTGAFLAQAAADPDVLAIKQTLYRTSVPEDPARGGEEAVVRSLISAAEAGKQVVVLVELKARFDEEANINWAKMLEAAGVHVVYGVFGLKTHAKLLLVVRREEGRIRRYSHIGTGNYNPKTARLYEDLGLLTADQEIGADLSELFNHLTGYALPTSYRKLLVAPYRLRDRVVERIREQARLGPQGHILMKINHLVDPGIIDELYQAAAAGCRVDLMVRGICSLRAPESNNITVKSIVGKFLEHSRIYRFGPRGDDSVYYIGSADMMPRNLDGRVEALVPVTDPRLKRRLEQIIDAEWRDDVLAWELPAHGSWRRVPQELGVDAHVALQQLAMDRARGEETGATS